MKKADLVKILKILIKVIFSFLFASILVLYITLNIYVKNKELRVTPEEIKNECTVELNDWQINCASEIITKNKNPKFARLPLITDAFSKTNEVSETYSNRKASLNRFYSINIKEDSVKSMDFYWD